MSPDGIVIVDDSEPDNVYHEIVLRRAGFSGDLRVFESPQDALRFLREEPHVRVSLLLLDMHMPGMDGMAFLAAAKEMLNARPDLQIMILSSSPMTPTSCEAAEVSAVCGYLTKPLSVARARELLAARSSRS